MKATIFAAFGFLVASIFIFLIVEKMTDIGELLLRSLGFTAVALPFIFGAIVLISYPFAKLAALIKIRSLKKILLLGFVIGTASSFILLTGIFGSQVSITLHFGWGGIPGLAAGYIWWRNELHQTETETLRNNS